MSLQTRSIAALACAMIAALLLGVLYAYGVLGGGSAVYSTAIGEHRTVHLEDGTTLEVNTHSRISVSFTRQSRTVELLEGEVLVDVGRDARPFQVRVGPAIVEDVGTRFSVRRDAEQLSVVVQSGKVNVGIHGARRAIAALQAGQAVTLSTRPDAPTPEVRELSASDVAGKLAWTDGFIVFGGQRLDELIADINRYNVRQILIEDPEVAALPLGGRFKATAPEDLAKILAATFRVRVFIPVASNEPIRLTGIDR